MPVININLVGGLAPSVLPRNLPDGGAQTAHNLLARTAEFRPLQADVAVAVSAVNNPASLHRLARGAGGALNSNTSQGWRVNAKALNYVKGQVNDDATERTYFTYADGSQPPRVITATGADRPVGVPAPATRPTVELLETDELSVSDLPEVATQSKSEIEAAIRASLVTSYQGNSIAPATPTAGLVGWIPHGPNMPSTHAGQWNWAVPMNGAAPAAGFEYVQRPDFAGREVTVSGVRYWAMAIDLHAPVQTVDGVALAAALTALKAPAPLTGPLLLPAEVTSIVASTVNYYALTSPPQAALLADALATTRVIRGVLDKTLEGVSNAAFSSPAFTADLARLLGTNNTTDKGEVTDRVAYAALTLEADFPDTRVRSARYWHETGGHAAIRADINSCIATDAKGAKTLDRTKLENLLRVGFEQIIAMNDTEAQKVGPRERLPAMIASCIAPLLELFSFDRLMGVWGQGGDTGNALRGAMAQAKVALDRLRDHYTAIVRQAPAAADNSYALGAGARASAAATVRTIESRFYVYTWVTDWGEESAPSPVSTMVELDQNDQVKLTLAAPGDARITHARIYRSSAGSQAAAFRYLCYYATQTSEDGKWTRSGEDTLGVPKAVTQYTDNQSAVELQEVCPTTTWLEPPERAGAITTNKYLRGLVSLPNGVMAGFLDNTVAFCEPFYPFAWPVEYQVTTEWPITALGSFQQTLVVAHHGGIDYVSGPDSASMARQPRVSVQTCASPRSMVSVESGVAYASPDGLCLATANGVQLLTANQFTREDWQKLRPETMVGAYHEQTYYLLYDNGAQRGCYALHLEPGGKLTTVDVTGSAFYQDHLSDRLYAVDGTSIKALFAGNTHRTGLWRSKIAVLPQHAGFAWIVAEADYTAPLVVRLYGDGELYHTATLANGAPQRLPAGRYIEYEIEVETTARWSRMTLASSGDELRSV